MPCGCRKYLENLDRGKSCGHLHEWEKLLRQRSGSDSARHACSSSANMPCCCRMVQNTLRILIPTRASAIHENGRNVCVGGPGVILRDGHVRRGLICLVAVANTLKISIAARVAAICMNGRNFCVRGPGVIPLDMHVRRVQICCVVVAHYKIP